MNKKLLLIIGFTLLAGILLLVEMRTHSYEPERNIQDFSASIIQKTEEAQNTAEDVTSESLAQMGFELVEEGMTDMFLGEIAIKPILAKKQTIRISDTEEVVLNIIEKKKNYPLILIEGYNQQENHYQVSELSKESFLLISNSEKNENRFVTVGKNTIIGLLYGPESKEAVTKILSTHNLETP
jgi:hypothetical protein